MIHSSSNNSRIHFNLMLEGKDFKQINQIMHSKGLKLCNNHRQMHSQIKTLCNNRSLIISIHTSSSSPLDVNRLPCLRKTKQIHSALYNQIKTMWMHSILALLEAKVGISVLDSVAEVATSERNNPRYHQEELETQEMLILICQCSWGKWQWPHLRRRILYKG